MEVQDKYYRQTDPELNFPTMSVGTSFVGSTISAPSNADMTFDNSGTGGYIF